MKRHVFTTSSPFTAIEKAAIHQHYIGDVLQESYWALGRGLGGSSNLNYMQYLRGSRHDYDEWANNGAIGWGYKDVLPYFIKSEDQRNGEFIRTGK